MRSSRSLSLANAKQPRADALGLHPVKPRGRSGTGPTLLALLLGVSLAAAQSTAPGAQPLVPSDAEKKKTRLEGSVASLTGEMLRKTTLRLQSIGPAQNGTPPQSYTESTNNEGKYVFDDVAVGRYTLSAEKAGFVTQRYGARNISSPGIQINVTEGYRASGMDIKMTPQAVVSGKITDQDGDPVTGAQVQVMRNNYVRGHRQLAPAGNAASNDQGEYRIANLAPGRYYLSVNPRNLVPALTGGDRSGSKGEQQGNVTTFYPNGLDMSSAAPLDVTTGAEMRGVDVRVRRAAVYSVRGKVMDGRTGAPAPAGLLVGFMPKDTSGSGVLGVLTNLTQPRPDGSVEFRNLIPGTYVLQVLSGVTLNGNTAPALTGRMEINITDSNIENLVFTLVPGAEINGTVKVEDSDLQTLLHPAAVQNPQAASTAAPAATPAAIGPRLLFALSDAEGTGIASPSSSQIKDDGIFQIRGVGTSKYSWNVLGLPDGTYVKSIRFGGQDITHASLDMTSGAPGAMEIVLSAKAADVSGSVHNEKGEPLAGLYVTVWPKIPDTAGTTGGVKQGITDQNGGYRIGGLAPGDYYVAAWEEIEQGLTQNADFISRFSREASELKLTESAHATLDTKLMPRDKIIAEMATIR